MAEAWCVMFAGQSIQERGFCAELWRIPAARAALERLKPSLGDDLEYITTGMPDEALALTFNAQRAIHAHHVGHWLALKAARPGLELDGAIGHSMGVAAALVAAGAMTIEDSGAFIRARAQAFSDVCKTFAEPMGLAAVSTDDFQDVIDEAEDFQGVSVALHNTRGRGTLGGTMAALTAFARKADEEGWPVKIKLLKVEGPYHTAAFAPCRPALEEALAGLRLRRPDCPVFMGTSGQAEADPDRIRRLLVEQADSPERHLDAVRAAHAAGCRSFIEASFKPQPVTWLADQLPAGAFAALALTPSDLSG